MAFDTHGHITAEDSSPKLDQLEALLGTPKGREALVAAMVQPLRIRLDFKNLCLRMLAPFPHDEPHEDADAWLSHDTTPELPREQIGQRRFSLIERAGDMARVELDRAAMEALIGKLLLVASEGPLDAIEGGHLLMNAKDFVTFRKQERDDIDSVTGDLRGSLFGYYKGAGILVSRLVPVGTVFSLGKPEDVGCYAQELSMEGREDLWDKPVGESPGRFAFKAQLDSWLRMTPEPKVTITKVIELTSDRYRSIPIAETS